MLQSKYASFILAVLTVTATLGICNIPLFIAASSTRSMTAQTPKKLLTNSVGWAAPIIPK